ncbi:hypothetical protein EDC04DRAFT_2803702 [Pisolithus marmoratus]|nr:hypothetical protein EDC04DRAFT_2803702 [Pisolithus marmoratus]
MLLAPMIGIIFSSCETAHGRPGRPHALSIMVFNFSRLHVHNGCPGCPVVLRTDGILFPFSLLRRPPLSPPSIFYFFLHPEPTARCSPPPSIFHPLYLDDDTSGSLANQDSSSTRRELSNGAFYDAIAAVFGRYRPLTGERPWRTNFGISSDWYPIVLPLLSCFAHISPNHAPNLSNFWEPTLLAETYRRIPKTRRSPLLCGLYLFCFSTGSFDFWTVRSAGRKLPGNMYRYLIHSAIPEIFTFLCTCSPATPLKPKTNRDAKFPPHFSFVVDCRHAVIHPRHCSHCFSFMFL